MAYMTVKQASERWNISDRRVRQLCAEGRIEGVLRKGRSYLIPEDALKPADGRRLRGKEIPEKYVALFNAVSQMKEALDRRRPLTSGELKRLEDDFLVEFTYNSNAIEGSPLTLQETALVLMGLTIDKKPLKEHLEAVGHRDAFLYILSMVREKLPLTERMIREIHSLVLPVKIMGAAHTPPEPHLVPEQMERLVLDLSDDKRHVIEVAAMFHLNFLGIHPFIDGNGRTGRLILNLMLMQAGYPPIDVKFTDRKKYYACFDRYFTDNDPAPMVNMVGEYLKEKLGQYLRLLKN